MLNGLERLLGALSDGINKISIYLIGIIVGLMITIITAQVILRYGFNSGFTWAEEVTIFLMAWMTFLGSAIALKRSGHINVDVVVDRLPHPLQFIVLIIGKLLVLTFAIVFLYYGYNFVASSTNFYSNALRIPLWIPRSSIVVAFIIMIIHLLHSIVKDFAEVSRR